MCETEKILLEDEAIAGFNDHRTML